MSDNRGANGRDDVEQPGGADVGGSDWLLNQLTGGRQVERPEAAHRSAVPAPHHGADSAPHHEDDEDELDGIDDLVAPPQPQAPVTDAYPPTVAFSAPEPGRVAEPAEPAGDFEGLLTTPPVEAERFEPLEEEVPVSFSWHLKPDAAVVDPLVAPDADVPAAPVTPAPGDGLPTPAAPGTDVPTPAAPVTPAPVLPPTGERGPASPGVPPVPTYTPPTEPYSSPAVSGPTPVVPPSVPPAAEVPDTTGTYVPPTPPSGWSIPSAPFEAPRPEPEEAQPAEPDLAASPADDEEAGAGHGFAALLGLFEPEAPEETPHGRSVIGDTTSVIPIPPEALHQPSVEPAESSQPEAHQHPAPAWPTDTTPATPVFPPPAAVPPAFPPAFAAPQPPAEPVLPPPHASALFEPAAETETRKLDTAEIAALLNAKTGDPDPDADRIAPGDGASGRRRADTGPDTERPQETVEEPPAFPAAGLGGGAVAGGAAATEAVLGAPPSPATSPIDAQSIAVASDLSAAEARPQSPFGAADDHEADADEEDGIAALFGPDAPVIEVADEGEPYLDGEPEQAEPGYAGADVEGPQLSATSPLFLPVEEAFPAPGEALPAPGEVFPVPGEALPAPGEALPASEEAFPAPGEALPASDEPVAEEARPEPTEAEAPRPVEAPSPVEAPIPAEAAREFPPAPPLFTPLASAPAAPPVSAPPAVPVPSAFPAAATTSRPTETDRPAPIGGPTSGAPGGPGDGGRTPGRPGGPQLNRTLLLVAGGVAVLLVLIGLFALGTRLPSLLSSAPEPQSTRSAAATPRPTPSVTATPVPVQSVVPKPAGPASAGTQRWDALGGGECLQPYTTPWAETFTVVDCGSSHAAQMVYTNLVNTDPNAPYPGADALAAQINGLCTATGVIDLSAAAAYPDLQVQGTFPATQQQWTSGQRSYYCFASRSGGKPMTSSVAGPGPGH